MGRHRDVDVTTPNADGKQFFRFSARLTIDDRIGSVTYGRGFPKDIDLHGLTIGMPREDFLTRHPDAKLNIERMEKYQEEALRFSPWPEAECEVFFADDCVSQIEFSLKDADYVPDAFKVRPGLKAYDVEMAKRCVDPSNNQGWVFGLPPGLTSEQWPLDPISGYPLMHGFTIRLPEDYRVHGPDIVALSFFATAADQEDVSIRNDLYRAIMGQPAETEEHADLKPFRDHAAHAHPRLHRMEDILGSEYAVILLTEEEFNGPACQPPRFAPNSYLNPEHQPGWLTHGAAWHFVKNNGGLGSGTYAYKVVGALPEKSLDWHRALQITPRAQDPNAGIPPVECFEEVSEQGYESPWDEDCDLKPWTRDHKSEHIGGTMRPIQSVPEFSPFYIEFEEYLGGYNFGGGNAQLDFLQMKFDWACG